MKYISEKIPHFSLFCFVYWVVIFPSQSRRWLQIILSPYIFKDWVESTPAPCEWNERFPLCIHTSALLPPISAKLEIPGIGALVRQDRGHHPARLLTETRCCLKSSHSAVPPCWQLSWQRGVRRRGCCISDTSNTVRNWYSNPIWWPLGTLFSPCASIFMKYGLPWPLPPQPDPLLLFLWMSTIPSSGQGSPLCKALLSLTSLAFLLDRKQTRSGNSSRSITSCSVHVLYVKSVNGALSFWNRILI